MFENDNSARKSAWMLSFIDLLSILLAFFILFYSLSGDFNKNSNDIIDVEFSSINNKNIYTTNVEYIKSLINIKISSEKINLIYNITTDKGALIINIDANNCFDKSLITVDFINFIRIIKDILYYRFHKTYIDYQYCEDIDLSIDKLINLKHFFDSILFSKNTELSMSKTANANIRIKIDLTSN